jgi:prepilin-type N-terminal cleavage/methylation domain-containing protein
MPAGRRQRAAGPAARPPGRRTADAGFTMVEVLVSVAVIGIIMTALTTFFISTVSATGRQGQQQAAIQLATDGAERARAIKSSAVVGGRDKVSSDNQWASPVAGVASQLSGMVEAWDSAAVYPGGASAPLPTTAKTVTVNGIGYGQNWYVGSCWQPATGGDCVATQVAGSVAFYRVIVAVTWSDRRCAGSACSYVSSTLLNSASKDPIFNPSQTAQPPTVDNPGVQTDEVSLPASLQLTASGGASPLTWTASGLPAGLTISSGGLVTGTPTAAGTSSVNAAVTDGYNLVGTAAFNWVINPALALTAPANQTSVAGTVVTALTLASTGGVGPLAWSVTAPGPWGSTGLPPGLAINATTGAITGTPTAAGAAKAVTVTVADALGATRSATFNWTVNPPPLNATAVAAQSSTTAAAITGLQLATTGGTGPYTWAAVNLPPGLTMTTGGLITGSPTAGTRYLVTATVTAAVGGSDPVTFVWTVATTTGIRITSPTGDRTGDRTGRSLSFTAVAAGPGSGGGGYTWSATGLPPGITINSGSGTVSGTPTTAGTYTAKLTATIGSVAGNFMFTWTIT